MIALLLQLVLFSPEATQQARVMWDSAEFHNVEYGACTVGYGRSDTLFVQYLYQVPADGTRTSLSIETEHCRMIGTLGVIHTHQDTTRQDRCRFSLQDLASFFRSDFSADFLLCGRNRGVWITQKPYSGIVTFLETPKPEPIVRRLQDLRL